MFISEKNFFFFSLESNQLPGIKLKSNRTVVTLAFLDSGSSATFCTELPMKKLDERGPKVKIVLSTLENKNSLVDSYLLCDITVSNLDENDFINLSTLYTRP